LDINTLVKSLTNLVSGLFSVAGLVGVEQSSSVVQSKPSLLPPEHVPARALGQSAPASHISPFLNPPLHFLTKQSLLSEHGIDDVLHVPVDSKQQKIYTC
jgi:hypothetical protein